MNAIERVLFHDVGWLVDRRAASIPEGTREEIGTTVPALDDLENLRALAVWRSRAEERARKASPLAA